MARKNLLPMTCPNFPQAFDISAASDLFRPIDPNVGVTLFFRDTQLKTGHHTLMWSMSKVMRKIAENLKLDSEEAEEALNLWTSHLRLPNDESIEALKKYLERNL